MISSGLNQNNKSSVPLWLLAELTYKCPLQCPYCSNPLAISAKTKDLSLNEWCDVLSQARNLGAVQLGLSGGEPLLKAQLERIILHASELGFYSNLITSGIGLSDRKIKKLKQAGLNHIQLSFQAASPGLNDWIGGRSSFEAKCQAAVLIKASGFPMVMNVVLHRHNISQIAEIIELAIELKADYLELAHVQYDGWAYLNQAQLLPSASQLEQAQAIAEDYQNRLKGKMKLIYVIPDYYADRPKACCGGWGALSMVITPDGKVLPCVGAQKIFKNETPNIRTSSLASIWKDSAIFNAFRGFEWMKEPCRSCPERFQDFGGCRCQAFLLTQDAANPDPVCKLTPARRLIDDTIASKSKSDASDFVYRNLQNSKGLLETQLIATRKNLPLDLSGNLPTS